MWRFEEAVRAAWKESLDVVTQGGEVIARQLREDLHSITARAGCDDLTQILSHREMFPSIPLIYWTADAVGFGDEEVLQDLAVGAFLAYFYIRFQDDVLDDHAGSPGGLLVGNVCLEGFYSRYRKHFPSHHPFWRIWADLLARYTQTTLWELRRRGKKRRVFTTADLERLGDKFLPATAPPAAVALLADRPELIASLEEIVGSLGRGLQLVNDHTGLMHDFKTHNYTAVICDILLGVPPLREMEELSFPQRTLTTDAMERNLRRSKVFFKCASTEAHRSGVSYVTAYSAEHEAYIEGEIRRLQAMRREVRQLDEMETENSMECLHQKALPQALQGGG